MSYLSAHITREEFACRCGCGLRAVDMELVKVLELMLFDIGCRYIGNYLHIEITSGNRCKKHNSEIGGAPRSEHINCIAADFKVWIKPKIKQIPPNEIAEYLENEYPHTYGIGRYNNRTHLDVREARARWDERT